MRALGNAARRDLAAQPLADGGDAVGAAQREGLERARGAIAQAAFAGHAVVDGRVFPERAHLVHHRDAAPPPDPQRGQHVQHRRVRVEDVGPELAAPARRCGARWPPSRAA